MVICAAALAGCGSAPAPPAAEAPPAKQFFEVDPAEAAQLSGHVVFLGRASRGKRLTMEAEKACQDLHKDPVFEDPIRTGKGGLLADVFVYVKTGLEGKNFRRPERVVVLDQKGCQFVPRVTGIVASQTLVVKNSDPVSHNIHPVPKNNRDWNQQQPPKSPDLVRRFAYPEVMIPVKCNIHAWMRTYIGVVEHPYFAVTSTDGAFSLDGLPPAEYVLAAWHEQLGELTLAVRLGRGERRTVRFEFPAPLAR